MHCTTDKLINIYKDFFTIGENTDNAGMIIQAARRHPTFTIIYLLATQANRPIQNGAYSHVQSFAHSCKKRRIEIEKDRSLKC